MATKLFEHPLRKFEITYDDSKPWTTQDEDLVNAFLNLHQYVMERTETSRHLMEQYAALNRAIGAARTEYQKVRKMMDETRQMAEVVIPAMQLNQVVVQEHFDKAVLQTDEAILEYDQVMRAIDLETPEPARYAFIEEQDDAPIWNQFDETNLEHSRQWEVNSIDTAVFTDTEEMFRVFVGEQARQQDQVIDYTNEVINNHHILMLETELLYEVWKEFVKRVQLLDYITGKADNRDFLSMN
ncbi:MAG: hypothetical protein U0T74_12240 [Chitinophagales bacterium]